MHHRDMPPDVEALLNPTNKTPALLEIYCFVYKLLTAQIVMEWNYMQQHP